MNKQNSLFEALADPTRRTILKLLRSAPLTPGEMIKHFSITKPSLSHHLDILKKADVVASERCGQNIVYTLNTTVFDELVALVMDIAKPPVQGGSDVSH